MQIQGGLWPGATITTPPLLRIENYDFQGDLI